MRVTRPVLVTTSAAVLAALVVAGCTPTPDQPTPTEQASTVPVESPSPAEPVSDSVCGLDAVRMAGDLIEAPASEWELVGTTPAPISAAMGPGTTDPDGLRSCFARTPEGAVFAAANILALGSSPALVGPMTDRLTVAGPGRDAAMADLAARVSMGGSAVRYEIAAFALTSYDGSTATVDVVIRASNQALLAQMIDLEWVDGDWKVALADSGQMRTPMGAVQSLAGYVPWGEP